MKLTHYTLHWNSGFHAKKNLAGQGEVFLNNNKKLIFSFLLQAIQHQIITFHSGQSNDCHLHRTLDLKE